MTEFESLQQAFDEMKELAAQRLAALKEAERQRDELKADAERYRWLKDQNYGGYAICKWDGGAGDYFRCINIDGLDAEIDAAIAAARKEQK